MDYQGMCREVPFGVTLPERAFSSLVLSKVYYWIFSVSALWCQKVSFPWTMSLLIGPLLEGGLVSFVPVLFILHAHFSAIPFSSVFKAKAAKSLPLLAHRLEVILIGCMGGAKTFACKSQECHRQDWYIFCYFSAVKEYCSTNEFDISCGENEAIMMQSAIYGRMQPGRCISGKQIHVKSKINRD